MITEELAAIEARANSADDSRGAIQRADIYRIEVPSSFFDRISASQRDVRDLLAAVRERDNTIARVRAELARHEEYLPAAVDYDCCGYCNYTTGSYIAWPCPTYVHLRAALDPQETP